MTAIVTDYHRVLQEESERVCGRHLPDEIVWMILYKWGGLQTPTGGIIRNLMVMSIRNSLGQIHRFVPSGTFSQDDFGELVSEEKFHDSSTVFASHINDVRLAQWIITTRSSEFNWCPYAYQTRSTAQGPVLVRTMYRSYLLSKPTSPYSVWQWQGIDIFQNPHRAGMWMRPRYLWMMAAKCRGVPEMFIWPCYRYDMPPTAAMPELYQLVLRAETDYTWRFWYDLFLAHRDYCQSVAIGQATGFMLVAGFVGVGARYLQSKMPGMSFLTACLGFVVTSRTLGKLALVGYGLLTDHWVIARDPQIGHR